MNQQLIGAAQAYHELGIPVIPFRISLTPDQNGIYDKTPAIDTYKRWQTEPQTTQDFNNLNWEGCNGFGIILGTKAKNGMYLSAIDYDTKNNAKTPERKAEIQKAAEAGKEILKDFPTTATEKTINDGIHLLYWSRQQPQIDGSFHDTVGIELLGYKKLCVMYPSHGYQTLNDNTPTEIENLETKFYQILEQHGYKKETDQPQEQYEQTLRMDKLVDLTQLTEIAPGDYQGKHPIHDSTTEKNFHLNTRTNTWFCFRHNSGGGAYQYLAVKEGIIKCEQAQRGALRGKKFKDVLNIAVAQGLLPKTMLETDEKESQADRLIKLCEQENVDLFHDQYKTPFARVKLPCDTCDTCDKNSLSESFTPQPSNLAIFPDSRSANGTIANIARKNEEPLKVSDRVQISQNIAISQSKTVTLPIRGKLFKSWLSGLMWNKESKAPSSEGLQSALNVLTAKAVLEGKEYMLYNRVAPAEDGIWIDMCDECWRAIKVTGEGWVVVDEPPILFKRQNHQKPLINPVQLSDEEVNIYSYRLLDYFNTDKSDTETNFALIVTIISYFIPLIAHAALVVHGPQGTAKSYLFKLTRELIDPSVLDLLTLPRDDKELAQQLAHNYMALYDNLSYLPSWASDMFCKAVTGTGISKRELYSDDDDTIYSFKRCIGLNGINIAAQRGDLLQRSLLVGLVRVPKEKRKTEDEINNQFQEEAPKILGALLTVLAKAIKLYPDVHPTYYFRLADFTRWGCAISCALGKTEQDFISAYNRKVQLQDEETINSSPLATVMLDFCKKNIRATKVVPFAIWEGTATELLSKLTALAVSSGVNVREREKWPQAANSLSRALNRVADALLALGCEVTMKEGTPRKVVVNANNVEVEKVEKKLDEPKRRVIIVEKAEMPHSRGKCPICKQVSALEKKIIYDDKSTSLICYGCGEQLALEIYEDSQQ